MENIENRREQVDYDIRNKLKHMIHGRIRLDVGCYDKSLHTVVSDFYDTCLKIGFCLLKKKNLETLENLFSVHELNIIIRRAKITYKFFDHTSKIEIESLCCHDFFKWMHHIHPNDLSFDDFLPKNAFFFQEYMSHKSRRDAYTRWENEYLKNKGI